MEERGLSLCFSRIKADFCPYSFPDSGETQRRWERGRGKDGGRGSHGQAELEGGTQALVRV